MNIVDDVAKAYKITDTLGMLNGYTLPAYVRFSHGDTAADEAKAALLFFKLIEDGSPRFTDGDGDILPFMILGEFMRLEGGYLTDISGKTSRVVADIVQPYCTPNGKFKRGSLSYFDYILTLLNRAACEHENMKFLGRIQAIISQSKPAKLKSFFVANPVGIKWAYFARGDVNPAITMFKDFALQIDTTGEDMKFSVLPQLIDFKTNGVGNCSIKRPIPEDANVYLDAFFEGVYPDEELRNFMYIVFACALNTRLHKSIIVHSGESGCGKSTVVDFLNHVFGSYAQDLSPGALRIGKDGMNSNLAKCFGKRLIFVSEGGNHPFSGEFIKRATSDQISTRQLFQETHSAKLEGLIHIVSNSPPKFAGFDDALGRRLICVPYVNKFRGSDDVKNVFEIMKEKCTEAFLERLKSYASCLDLREFQLPKACIEARQQWYNYTEKEVHE